MSSKRKKAAVAVLSAFVIIAYAKKKKPKLNGSDRNEQNLFASFVRMSKIDFDYLLDLVTPSIKKQDTVMREPIHPGARLALTLQYLATGNSFCSIQSSLGPLDCKFPHILDT